MYYGDISHLDIIVKDGTVRIPSIFMFESGRDVTDFLDRCREVNCTVIFENENIKVLPDIDDGVVGAMLSMYKTIVTNREIMNAYLRYLGNLDKMGWDELKQG